MKHQADWLLQELPQLEREGVLDAATAARLRQHYAGRAASAGWTGIVFPLLGLLLIGLGIVLLVAHNWDQLSRPVRLLLAFTPLAVGQIACIRVMTRDGSLPWREAWSAFTALAFAAALALVGQIYHFPGDLDRYLLTCGLVALPLAYLMNVSAVLVLCAAAFAGWSMLSWDIGWSGRASADAWRLFGTLGLFALLAPQVWRLARSAPESLRLNVVLAALVPMFFVAVLGNLLRSPVLGIWWFAELGALLVMLDALTRNAAASVWRRPLALYGGLATTWGALLGSFPETWRMAWSTDALDAIPQQWAVLVIGMALLAVLSWRVLQRGNVLAAMQIIPALVLALVASADVERWAIVLAIFMTLYVLVLGLARVRIGLAQRDSGLATGGLLLIAVLILLRFLDTEWSFTARGIAFLLTGAAFLAANAWMRRKVRA